MKTNWLHHRPDESFLPSASLRSLLYVLPAWRGIGLAGIWKKNGLGLPSTLGYPRKAQSMDLQSEIMT
jgi:hypothetical protein